MGKYFEIKVVNSEGAQLKLCFEFNKEAAVKEFEELEKQFNDCLIVVEEFELPF